MNERDLFLFQTGIPHPLIQLCLGWRHGRDGVVIERLRVPQPCKPTFNRLKALREARRHKSEARVVSWEFSVPLLELSDDLAEFSRRDVVVLHLNVYPEGLLTFPKAEVKIAGAFMEQLMKSRIEKPDRKLAYGVSRLKPEPLARRKASHRLRR